VRLGLLHHGAPGPGNRSRSAVGGSDRRFSLVHTGLSCPSPVRYTLKAETMDEAQRADVLIQFGAQAEHVRELLAYNINDFRHDSLARPTRLPLDPELHVAVWEDYASKACSQGVFQVLKDALVQLHFPVVEGLSQTEDYRAATLRGSPVSQIKEATGLCLLEPGRLELRIERSLAGAIPVIIARNPGDFRLLVQALTMRNEPGLVPDSMGACIVGGYNNWDRIGRLRKVWEEQNPGAKGELEWRAEFRRIVPQKELYQDRFIILSDKPYSGVPGSKLGMSREEWQSISLKIRLEHECAHYLARRLLSRMKNNILDELIADYCGIVAATGKYRASWFLIFLGLDDPLAYTEGGRLQNYRGEPPLSTGAFLVLQRLVKAAAEHVEQFQCLNIPSPSDPLLCARMAVALARLTMEELACPEANELLMRAWRLTEDDVVMG
jgi:hypothetical protein